MKQPSLVEEKSMTVCYKIQRSFFRLGKILLKSQLKMVGHMGKVWETGERRESIFSLFLTLFLRCSLLITVRERILDWTCSGPAQLSHIVLPVMEVSHVWESEVESISIWAVVN